MLRRLALLAFTQLAFLSACAQGTLAATVTPVPTPTATSAAVEPAAEYTPTPEPVVDTPEWSADGVLCEIFVSMTATVTA